MNNYIEINTEDVVLSYERQMLAEINIPSLLPVNVINQNGQESICYITNGYKTVSDLDIPDIETLCTIIKSFTKAIIVSEQYLLMGGKHFLETNMVFYDYDKKEIKLVFGKVCDENHCFGDIDIIIEFLSNLKHHLKEKVHIQLVNKILSMLKLKNPELKRISIIVEEMERKWYCRNLIPDFPFKTDIMRTEGWLN
jgi:hypothetical protein